MGRDTFVSFWRILPRWFRRVTVATVGSTLLLIGLAFTVLPGPGIPIVIAAFIVLAAEFAWARHILEQLRSKTSRLRIPRRHQPNQTQVETTEPTDTPIINTSDVGADAVGADVTGADAAGADVGRTEAANPDPSDGRTEGLATNMLPFRTDNRL
jgi:hypothetical protein